MGNHTLLSSSAVLASRSVYSEMIYVNIGLNGVWIQHFHLSCGSLEDLCVRLLKPADGPGWSGIQTGGWAPLLIDIPIVPTWSSMHQWSQWRKPFAVNVLQFTKHKSTSTLRLCDVYSAEMKLTVIIVYGVISHWAPKSFDNRSSYASVISGSFLSTVPSVPSLLCYCLKGILQ